MTSIPLSTARGTERETRERERRERERREGGGREERRERREERGEKRERENHGSTLPFLYSLQRVENLRIPEQEDASGCVSTCAHTHTQRRKGMGTCFQTVILTRDFYGFLKISKP